MEPAYFKVFVHHAVAGLAKFGIMVYVDFVVVVRVVLISVQRDVKAALRGMLRIGVGLMGVERTERVGGVNTGTPAVVSDDIDGPAERVAAQFDRHHALVHLHALCQDGRDIVQAESRTHAVHRHSVDEYLYVAA